MQPAFTIAISFETEGIRNEKTTISKLVAVLSEKVSPRKNWS